jgi:hypothetical protein
MRIHKGVVKLKLFEVDERRCRKTAGGQHSMKKKKPPAVRRAFLQNNS